MFDASCLESERLRLIPIAIEHLPQYESIFLQNVFINMKSTQYVTAAEFLEDKFSQYKKGLIVPYSVISKYDNSLIGFTSLASISMKNKYLENSGTWIGEKYQKQGYNSEIKFILLKYVFETINFSRVNFVVEIDNKPSLNTLEFLGIKRVGLIQNWIIVNGKQKDGIMFIATNEDWPDIKIKFERNVGSVRAAQGAIPTPEINLELSKKSIITPKYEGTLPQ